MFADLRGCAAAKDRTVLPDAVIERRPDVILASWCGKKVRIDKIRSRPGWEAVPAVAQPPHLRDQIAADPAARPRGADRWARCHPRRF